MIDLTNKTVATITDCDQEPIHIPGSIQSHGYLIAFKNHSNIVTHASANVAELFGLSLPAILGQTIFSILPNEAGEVLRSLTIGRDFQTKAYTTQILERGYQCMVHQQDTHKILEIEPLISQHPDAPQVQSSDLLDVVNLSDSLTDLCQSMAGYFQTMLGYDRVMIYRFDQENHTGEVIAESLTEGLEPYLGLRYPASDIPPQARELYLKNPLRIINHVDYQPVALYTLASEEGTVHQLDLSRSSLRSVSPIHIQYLKNMGVASSLSVALIRGNQLWGLIACHHNAPRYLSLRERDSAQLLGLLLSSQIEFHERAESSAETREVEQNLAFLASIINKKNIPLPDAVAMPELLTIADATGVALLAEGKLYTNGLTPTPEEIGKLALFLSEYTGFKSLTTKYLATIYPEAERLNDSAAGIIYEPLGFLAGDCLLWFRPGLEQTITWAGQPKEPDSTTDTFQRLTPRSSFSAWQETVRHTSQSWSSTHVLAAGYFASLFSKQLRLQRLQLEAEKQRSLNEKMKAANEELENIHWISMHDLKEPLRKIQVLASRVLSQEAQGLTASLMDSINRMHNSAKRMQNLLEDISAYSRLSSEKELFAPVDLQVLVDEIIHEKQKDINARNARIEFSTLPTILGIRYQLKQLFANLIDNALKFGKPGEDLRVTLSRSLPTPEVVQNLGASPDYFFTIVVQDNGIGFENDLRDIIFRLFKRLDSVPHGPQGTGIGLAVCKKVMLNHDGYIWVDSEPERGSIFQLVFPITQLV